jgi:tellurite resistance protein TerC
MDTNIAATPYHWIVFNLIIFTLLGIDLWNSWRRPHEIETKEAVWTSLAWISLALLFNLWLYREFGKEPALAFFTGYLLEKSLSVDNLFVFLIIFSHFKVPAHAKHTVLFYGILGAVLMRAALIFGGITLISTFGWIFYIFGAFLIYTGFKLAFKKDEEIIKIEENIAHRTLSYFMATTPKYHDGAFVIKKENKWTATPLLIVLLLIEMTDLIFALDSVPAILGITTDPFIVYTSNIFAILGLRSLFFVLEQKMNSFHLLHYALAAILIFIGVKMLVADWIHIPVPLTLGILVFLLFLACLGSVLFPKNPGNIRKK